MTEASPALVRLVLKDEVEQFLYHEAELLDERRYEEWLTLFTDDVRYWMPMRRNVPHDESAREFTREGLAVVRNQCFIDFCASKGDHKTAKLYGDIIQPDEQHHHELGRRLLLRYAVAPDAQELARNSARRTLELAEEIQEMARLRMGISRAPGC